MRPFQIILPLALASACGGASAVPAMQTGAASPMAVALSDVPPPAPPARWLGLIGEYGPDSDVHIVLERNGGLDIYTKAGGDIPMTELSPGVFRMVRKATDSTLVTFKRDGSDRAALMAIGTLAFARRQVGPESGNQLLVPPIRPIPELRREALAASPPAEKGPFRASDLVELTALDPTIKLDIRYATSNNLFGTPFYTQARAFLQRPAAEAVVRASKALHARGYGLLVHDGYRPWYVTKMFWDASPDDKHVFVADPALGSHHNRGAAVDLTLYDLATGAPVDMVSTYDETSDRAYPDYPGGTSRQRWHRALLRRAMEAERFTVYEAEWWHFDYADWKEYPIGNVVFEKLGLK
jgi:D-alanyl-D-alanine dipeptidase